jgi:hypothetical protein
LVSRNTRQTTPRNLASHEVFVPFSVCRLRCAVPRRPAPRTVPLRRSIASFSIRAPADRRRFGQPHARIGNEEESRPCGFGICVCALRDSPCAARAAGTITVHTGSIGSCAAVSLWRGVPLPALVEPCHNRTARPRFFIRADAATLLGFLDPSQCSPFAGPGVCDAMREAIVARHLRRSSPHAVIKCTPPR